MADLTAYPSPRAGNPVLRLALMAAGFLFVGIGILGIFLPLLPHTIFFLLAAGCFGKSSPRAYRWLTTNRWFGRYLRDYVEEHGMTGGSKVFTIAFLVFGIALTIVLIHPPIWVEALLALVIIGVTWHLLSLATIRRRATAEADPVRAD